MTSKIIFFLGFYGFSLFSSKHSDEEMRNLIAVCQKSILKARSQDCPVIKLRCPYDDKPESSKQALVEQGFLNGLYSDAIRKELLAKRMYPMMPIDLSNQPFVQYFCEF